MALPSVIIFTSVSCGYDSLPVDNPLVAGAFLGLPEKTILHSGPPIEFERMCILHHRGMVNACLFEGWAKTVDEAEAMLARGEVRVAAAMDYATVGSGTGIVTASVPLTVTATVLFGEPLTLLQP